jgi:hypothetical protein
VLNDFISLPIGSHSRHVSIINGRKFKMAATGLEVSVALFSYIISPKSVHKCLNIGVSPIIKGHSQTHRSW